MTDRMTLQTPDAPSAIGPYAQGISLTGAQRIVFLSGQIPIDPSSGELVTGDIAAQTTQVMKNLGAVLSAASMTFDDVVRATIYLTDLGQFAAVNEVYGSFFAEGRVPARATVEVCRLPKGADVEIDAIAAI